MVADDPSVDAEPTPQWSLLSRLGGSVLALLTPISLTFVLLVLSGADLSWMAVREQQLAAVVLFVVGTHVSLLGICTRPFRNGRSPMTFRAWDPALQPWLTGNVKLGRLLYCAQVALMLGGLYVVFTA